MKFSCLRDNLSKSLSLIGGLAGRNINLPILANILIKVSEQKVELLSTNLEMAATAYLRAKVDIIGSFTVPTKTLIDFVNLLSDEKVVVELKESELDIICGKSSTKIKGTPADDFPTVPTLVVGEGFLLEADGFCRGLEQVVQSASRNEIRPELSGVLFNFNPEGYKGLMMAATDSYRLAEKKIKILQGEENNKRVIVPLRAAQEIARILNSAKGPEAEQNVRLMLSDNQIMMRNNEVEFVSRLTEGLYPDYTQIIPINFSVCAEVDTKQLIKEVKAASLFTTTGVNAVVFDIDPIESRILISSMSTQTGAYKSEVSAEINGEKKSILLNHRYILDGLGNMKTEKTLIKIVNGDSPCVLMEKGETDYLYIIMPIRQ